MEVFEKEELLVGASDYREGKLYTLALIYSLQLYKARIGVVVVVGDQLRR